MGVVMRRYSTMTVESCALYSRRWRPFWVQIAGRPFGVPVLLVLEQAPVLVLVLVLAPHIPPGQLSEFLSMLFALFQLFISFVLNFSIFSNFLGNFKSRKLPRIRGFKIQDFLNM